MASSSSSPRRAWFSPRAETALVGVTFLDTLAAFGHTTLDLGALPAVFVEALQQGAAEPFAAALRTVGVSLERVVAADAGDDDASGGGGDDGGGGDGGGTGATFAFRRDADGAVLTAVEELQALADTISSLVEPTPPVPRPPRCFSRTARGDTSRRVKAATATAAFPRCKCTSIPRCWRRRSAPVRWQCCSG
jgi:hypothetical protein